MSGSGDVLAGIIGGLLARGAAPLTALLWGVWLHGEAGRKLDKEVGSIGYLAREIPGQIQPTSLCRIGMMWRADGFCSRCLRGSIFALAAPSLAA